MTHQPPPPPALMLPLRMCVQFKSNQNHDVHDVHTPIFPIWGNGAPHVSNFQEKEVVIRTYFIFHNTHSVTLCEDDMSPFLLRSLYVLCCAGIDSEFAIVEAVITCIKDRDGDKCRRFNSLFSNHSILIFVRIVIV
jgi:hypothetical protein